MRGVAFRHISRAIGETLVTARAQGIRWSSMAEWMEVAMAFAGPVATIVAAGTAAWITSRFGRIQAGIARMQVDIARAQKNIAKSQRNIAYARLRALRPLAPLWQSGHTP